MRDSHGDSVILLWLYFFLCGGLSHLPTGKAASKIIASTSGKKIISFAAAKRIIQVSHDAARINYIYLSSEMAHVTPHLLWENASMTASLLCSVFGFK